MFLYSLESLGKKLNLNHLFKIVFGIYRSFYIKIHEKHVTKHIEIALKKPIKNESIKFLKNKYNIKNINFSKNNFLKVEIISYLAYNKIYRIINDIIDICNHQEIQTHIKCDLCTNLDVNFYNLNNKTMLLCNDCLSKENKRIMNNFLYFQNNNNFSFKNLFFILIFTLLLSFLPVSLLLINLKIEVLFYFSLFSPIFYLFLPIILSKKMKFHLNFRYSIFIILYGIFNCLFSYFLISFFIKFIPLNKLLTNMNILLIILIVFLEFIYLKQFWQPKLIRPSKKL